MIRIMMMMRMMMMIMMMMMTTTRTTTTATTTTTTSTTKTTRTTRTRARTNPCENIPLGLWYSVHGDASGVPQSVGMPGSSYPDDRIGGSRIWL